MAKRIFTKSLLFSGIAFLLAGCATPYQKSSLLNVWMPGGFAETQIDDTTFNVRFAGNGNTSEEKIGRYLLYRCAELTRERGFRYFVLVPGGFTGGVSLNDRLRDSPNRPEMVKVRSSGHLVIIPGAISSEVRKKSLTIFMFQNPKAVPYRMLGWKADVVLRDLEDYVRSGGDKGGYIPPASFFDPVSGEIPPGSLAGRPDGNTRQIDGAHQNDKGAVQGRDTDRYSTMPAPAKSGDTAMPGAVRPDQRRYDGSTPIDSLDDLLPDANNAR